MNLYSVHDKEGRHLVPVGGWCVDTVALSENPQPVDYSVLRADINWLVRLNWGYGSTGTYPVPNQTDKYIEAIQRYVAGSKGVFGYIIGNEPNHEQERPDGVYLTPEHVALVYGKARNAIKVINSQNRAIVPPFAPYHANPTNWLDYATLVYDLIDAASGADGVAIHAYTRSSNPKDITSEAEMEPPLTGQYSGFRVYQDNLAVIPEGMNQLPVFLTEFNELLNDGWHDANTGVVKAAYQEINNWNLKPGTQKIYCLTLYRWPNYDKWHIEGKNGVIEDFQEAVLKNYQTPNGDFVWEPDESTPMPPQTALPPRDIHPRAAKKGTKIQEILVSPGTKFWRVQKLYTPDEKGSDELGPDHHILVNAYKQGDLSTVLAYDVPLTAKWGSGSAPFKTKPNPGYAFTGDYALTPGDFSCYVDDGNPSETVTGIKMGAETEQGWNPNAHTSTLIDWYLVTMPSESTQPPNPVPGTVKTGVVIAPAGLNVRTQPDTEAVLLGTLPYGSTLLYDHEEDGWLHLSEGWVSSQYVGSAEGKDAPLPDGPVPVIPQNPPVLEGQIVPALVHPVSGSVYPPITQVFGVNRDYYKQFKVDGVPLNGHNGVDFGIPVGTIIQAVYSGDVIEVANDPEGYGLYIKLKHFWGETLYAHLSQQDVRVGDKVSMGQMVGLSGNTGKSTGPHLHFGMRVNPYNRKDGWGGYIDPLKYLGGIFSSPKLPVSSFDIRVAIEAASLKFDVEWELLASLAWAESSFDPEAEGGGLFQIGEDAWFDFASKVGATNIDDPDDNALVGAAYFRFLLDHYDQKVYKALIAYNFGVGNVDAGKLPPQITIEYVNKVLHGRDLLKALGV